MRFIEKHQLHIYDRRFTSIGLVVSLPLMWLERRYVAAKVSHTTLWIIFFVTVVLVTDVVAQLVGSWWYKRQIAKLRAKGYEL